MKSCWGGIACNTFLNVGINIRNAFFLASPLIMVTLFVVGAAFVVFSAGQDTPLQTGKKMMIASLIGLAIIVGSYAIFRTSVFILYSGG